MHQQVPGDSTELKLADARVTEATTHDQEPRFLFGTYTQHDLAKAACSAEAWTLPHSLAGT